MKTIASIEDIKEAGRPIGDMRREKLLAYISEAEITQVKPLIGDALYIALLKEERDNTANYVTLLHGGEYTDQHGDTRYFAGLLAAISYFVYIKTLMTGDIESTRYGIVQKENQYGSHVTDAARSSAYNEATEVAAAYLRDCIEFCKDKGLITSKSSKPATLGGCTIRKIG